MLGPYYEVPEALRHDWPLVKQRKCVFAGWRQRSTLVRVHK